MINDELITCKRCGSDACYHSQIDSVDTYMCWTCGFSTTSNHKENSDIVKELKKSLPELYKDLKFVDDQRLVWMPCIITLPDSGMVFIDGRTEDDYKWAAVKMVPLTEEEISSGKFKGDQLTKADFTTIKYFDKLDFMSAAEHIGIFN